MRQVGGAQEPGLTKGMQGRTGGMRVAAEIRLASPSASAPLLTTEAEMINNGLLAFRKSQKPHGAAPPFCPVSRLISTFGPPSCFFRSNAAVDRSVQMLSRRRDRG
jgi:hypothetical protein